MYHILIQISMTFRPKGPNMNKSPLIPAMASHRTLPELMASQYQDELTDP